MCQQKTRPNDQHHEWNWGRWQQLASFRPRSADHGCPEAGMCDKSAKKSSGTIWTTPLPNFAHGNTKLVPNNFSVQTSLNSWKNWKKHHVSSTIWQPDQAPATATITWINTARKTSSAVSRTNPPRASHTRTSRSTANTKVTVTCQNWVIAESLVCVPTDLPAPAPAKETSKFDQNSAVITLKNTIENFKGGKLAENLNEWQKLTSDKWILNTIQGYSIEFSEKPQQYKSHEIRLNAAEKAGLAVEIIDYYAYNIVEPCMPDEPGSFYGNLFTKVKKNGSFRVIFNLKKLTPFLEKQKF